MNKNARLSLCLAGLVILALPTTVDGAGWGDSTSVDLEDFNYFAANPALGEVTKVVDDPAFIGGGQIGYNYAFNKVVAGIEADFSAFDIRAAKIPASSKADWGSDTRVVLR